MKKYVVLALIAVFAFSCTQKQPKTTVTVNPVAESVNTLDGENFDLALAGQLAMQSVSVGEFEQTINDPEVGLNNLDLDGNGEADWITVTEANSSVPTSRLMSLSVNFSETDVEHIADIEIDKTSSAGGEVHLRGSERLYGDNNYYRNSFSMSDAILFHYMFGPRYRPYHSPYYAYRTPAYYRPVRVVPITRYRTQTRTVRTNRVKSTSTFAKSNTAPKSKVSSPNKGKSSTKYTKTKQVRSKTASQKQFNKATAKDKQKLNSGNSAFKKPSATGTKPKASSTKPVKSSYTKTSAPKKTPTTYKAPKKPSKPSRTSRTSRSSSSSSKRRK